MKLERQIRDMRQAVDQEQQMNASHQLTIQEQARIIKAETVDKEKLQRDHECLQVQYHQMQKSVEQLKANGDEQRQA